MKIDFFSSTAFSQKVQIPIEDRDCEAVPNSVKTFENQKLAPWPVPFEDIQVMYL
jgi:hypothetical protein